MVKNKQIKRNLKVKGGFMRLPTQDSATGRALKTGVQAIFGFMIGLIVTVWAVPGVPNAIFNYLEGHIIEVLLVVGIPSGLVSMVWNYLRKDVSNY